MSKYSLKPLTNTSWILSTNGERVALVSQLPTGHIKLIGKLNEEYKTFDQLEKNLGKITIESAYEVSSEPEQGKIGNLPVKHSTWYNTMPDPVPNYTRTDTSTTRYAAGYFGLKFQAGWSSSFCPKLSTLTEYEYIGPFTTKIEMQQQISSKQKNPTFK